MKKRVEELVNGKFAYEHPKLTVSDASIDVTLSEGESYKGEICFAAEDNSTIKGMLISGSRRILLSQDRFYSSSNRVIYGIDTEGLKPGSKEESQIVIMSDIGEVTIPVCVTIHKGQVKSSRGELTSLDDFVELAKEDYREAFRIFTGKNFMNFSPQEQKACRGLYKGMAHNPVTYQHMEEFLIGIGKKEPVTLSLDKENQESLQLEHSIKDTLYIRRSGWGYVRAEVEVDGDFLEVEKKNITAEDFIGSVYGLEYVILKSKLGSGKRYGRIRIRTVYGELTFAVTASGKSGFEISIHDYENKTKYQLTKCYLDRCLGEIGEEQWREETLQILSQMKNSGNYNALCLIYEAWIYLNCGRVEEGQKLLWTLEGRTFAEDEVEEEAAYLYVMHRSGLHLEQSFQYVERLRSLYRRNPKSFLLLRILIEDDEELAGSAVKRMDLMEQQFDVGVTSPLLYYEAYQVLKDHESQLKKLSPFMIQVLFFAGKHQMLTKELGMRIAHLAGHEKNFRQSVYQILCYAWEVYPKKDLLEAICRLVMLGQPNQKEYFKWYARAVEEDVRITRLYECYIETMSRNYQGEFPRAVKLYFSYNNTLSSECKAFIYAKVIRSKTEDPRTYEMYQKQMEAFAVWSLAKGKINEDFAVIYQEFITEIHNENEAAAYASVMFSYRLYSDDPKVRNVIVSCAALKEERIYPCRDGVAYINLYTPDAQILFEDSKHRRYVSTVDYNLQKLMDVPEMVRQCIAYNIPNAGLLVHICGSEPMETEVTIKNMGCFQLVADSEVFEEAYRYKVRRKLLDYYDKNAGDDTLSEYLEQLDYEEFYKVDYVLLQEVLIRHGFCQKAFELIQRYGYEGIPIPSLLKLCRRLILDMEYTENEELLYLARYVMNQGKYDEVILGYLRDSYMGPVSELICLWERLKGFQMDTYTLDEEILLTAMYTRVTLPKLSKILESYMKHRGKEIVIEAFFTYLSYGYFLSDIRIDMFVFKSLEHLYERGWNLDIMCQLALLKRYRFSKKLNAYQKENIRGILENCHRENLRFEFFQRLPRELTRGYQLEDKVFVEKQFSSNAQVTLHYAIFHEDEERAEYRSEPLRKGFHGIFIREFLLFYGEHLKYYLTVTENGKTYHTEEESLVMGMPSSAGTSRYDMINQMLAYHEAGDDEQCRKVLKKYHQMERLTGQLFSIME